MTLPFCIPTLPGKPLKGAHGIGACAQDEHQGCAARHVLIQSGQVYWRCLDKLLAKILYHKVCKSKNHLKVRKKKKMLKVVCGMRMFYIPIPVFSLLEEGVLYFDI